MGFSPKIKNEILIDAARHCCVCHRYKGVNVEVHHIEPQASGGSNTYENAIALCFDCHADAGHYNPSHPRGTKFSPSELRKAKERWFRMVKENDIPQAIGPDKFYCRYYLCKNYEQLVEISQGDLARFPVENPLLISNEIIETLKRVIANHPKPYRYANAWGKALSSKEQYFEIYPDAKLSSEKNDHYPYFQVVRTPSKAELESLCKNDGLLYLMLKSDLQIEKMAMVGGYYDGCGGVELQEEFIFRKLWCSFLAITNLSDKPVALDSIVGTIFSNDGGEFSGFNLSCNNSQKISLPKAPVPYNSTVLLPLAVILPPFYSEKRNSWSETYDNHNHLQVVSHEGVTVSTHIDYLVHGSQIITNAINYKIDGKIESQDIHEFDLSNMYTIDRSWERGSCPHLFLVGQEISYSKEILSHCCLKHGKDSLRIPEKIKSIIIAELEDEVTEITYLKVNGRVVLKNFKLNKNESISLDVHSGAYVEIAGRYIPYKMEIERIPCGIKRNELISEFLYLC